MYDVRECVIEYFPSPYRTIEIQQFSPIGSVHTNHHLSPQLHKPRLIHIIYPPIASTQQPKLPRSTHNSHDRFDIVRIVLTQTVKRLVYLISKNIRSKSFQPQSSAINQSNNTQDFLLNRSVRHPKESTIEGNERER